MHTEYIYQNHNKTIILFIHGILGSPKHFTFLYESLPSNVDYKALILKGHMSSVDDFSNATMSKWKAQVHNEILDLSKQYENIIIVAHSMGTLFSIQESLSNDKIKLLFLLNVPLKVYLHPKVIINSLKMVFGFKNIDSHLQESCSIKLDKRLWKYLKWIPNYLSLFKEIRYTRKLINKIKTNKVVFFSKHDELVRQSSNNYFKDKILLIDSGHFYYSDEDKNIIKQNLINCIQKLAN